MSVYFEELDDRPTPIGTLSLRRCCELSLAIDVFEIVRPTNIRRRAGPRRPIALARLELLLLCSAPDLDVVVGGLGLGYTAEAVLEHKGRSSCSSSSRRSMWSSTCMKRAFRCSGSMLTADLRLRFVRGDHSASAACQEGFYLDAPG